MERNILLTIQYDGSAFKGWQRQPGERTVQGVLEEALSKFCGTSIQINGTSRTDSGVHALMQCASFKGDFKIPLENLVRAVNNYLQGGMSALNPVGDVRILEAKEMPEDFHARFNCKGKTYRYEIQNSGEVDIFKRNYRYFVTEPLDIEKMQKAATYILGTHDFCSFQAAGGNPRETTVRTIFHIDICEEADLVSIEITGDGFLYNMVRIIVGTLVEVGLGKREPEELKEIIEKKDRTCAGHTAPAAGLYLKEIYF